MLRSLRDLERYTVLATDGKVGSVDDVLLDDEQWGIRHFVVKTGNYFDERRVLLSPLSIAEIDWASRRLQVALTMDKIRKSPNVDMDKPVSRQNEMDCGSYYGYGAYWGPFGVWEGNSLPVADASVVAAGSAETPSDVHLRSANELRGYHVRGTDEAIGHIADFVVDDQTWTLRYLVIDTSNWGLGKSVLIAPHWATSLHWPERTLDINLTRQAIKDSPPWDPKSAVNRAYESRLYDYYGRPVYWDAERGAPVARPAQINAQR